MRLNGTQVIINPEYRHLSDFVHSLPTIYDKEGELVYDERNQVRFFTVDGRTIVVKRFKKPMLHQRIDYTVFRPSKAKRAYQYGMKLVELGISTPTPIACVETFSKGLFLQGYLVTEYCGDPDSRILREEPEGHDELVEAVAKYLVDCHEKGFLHGDTNLSNFLYHQEGSTYHITAIDINRVRCIAKAQGPVGNSLDIHSFAQGNIVTGQTQTVNEVETPAVGNSGLA